MRRCCIDCVDMVVSFGVGVDVRLDLADFKAAARFIAGVNGME